MGLQFGTQLFMKQGQELALRNYTNHVFPHSFLRRDDKYSLDVLFPKLLPPAPRSRRRVAVMKRRVVHGRGKQLASLMCTAARAPR